MGGGDGIFNVASLCGLMSECSEVQRVSEAVSGFRGPGLAVVPLTLHWEFPEPWVQKMWSTCLCFFFPSLYFGEKLNIITRSVLPASWEEQPELLATSLPAKLPSKIGQVKRS